MAAENENGHENGNENGKRKLSDDENGDEASAKKMRAGKECGTLLFSGLTDYALKDKKVNFNNTDDVKWEAHRFEVLEGIRFREVSSGPVAYFTYAITEDGQVYAWGLNQKGQLGLGDNMNRKNPTLVEAMKGHNVVGVAVGRHHGFMWTDLGEVFGCGNNSCGQLGIGKNKITTTLPTKVDDKNMGTVKSISCGDEFSLFLNDDGKVFAAGTPENGQTGMGSEGKEIRGKKEIFHYEYQPKEIDLFIEKEDGETVSHGQPNIVYIASGTNHSCAIDDQQRLFTWGFGGYGRLGHNSTANELRPRLMKCWYRTTGRADGGVTKVWCGNSFNIVDTIIERCKYMFGQYNTTKEANMYPKFMDDLQGWNVRDVACSGSGYLICADDSLIGSQPSPGYGQLAMGPGKKASAQPILITKMKDLFVLRTGQGYMHSCFIVRDTTTKDQEAIEKFPTMVLEENLVEEVDEEEAPAGKKAKGKGGANNKKTATKTAAKKKK